MLRWEIERVLEENEKKSSLLRVMESLNFWEKGKVCVCVQKSKWNEGGEERALVLKELGQNSNDALIWAY